VRYPDQVAAVLIVKTGTTVPAVLARRQDFEVWITAGMGLAPSAVRVCRVYMGDALPDPRDVAGVVVTGSAAMVTDREAWSERTAAWLRDAVTASTPLLGICYGHQLLAHAFGGTVELNPRGRNLGTVDVALTEAASREALFTDTGSSLHVPVSHLQSVTRLPAEARLLGSTARDPNHAFAIGERAWGVQFHPEFDADIVRGYIEARREQLQSEGLDAPALAGSAQDTPHGGRLLRRFAQLVAAGG
jgi:GMP synthase (glutamine-hydrolysing)